MAVNPDKCDPVLGAEVQKYLIEKGIDTPVTELVKTPNDEKVNKILPALESFVEDLGLDMEDDSLQDTPRRLAKMYVNELTWGLNYDNFPKCTRIENKMDYSDNFVLERGVTIMSLCEHHFVTIDGLAEIAYIPDQYVLGLSKLNRIAQFFSRRPQVQERLTEQIRHAIQFCAKTEDVAVVIKANHYCVKSRGIQDQNSDTLTASFGGVFADVGSDVRKEFLSCCRS